MERRAGGGGGGGGGGGRRRGGGGGGGKTQTKPSSWFLPDAPSSKGRPWSVRRPHRYPGSRNSLMTPDGGLSGVQPSLCHPALPRVGPKPSDLHFQVEHVRGPDPRPVSHLPAPPGPGVPPSSQPHLVPLWTAPPAGLLSLLTQVDPAPLLLSGIQPRVAFFLPPVFLHPPPVGSHGHLPRPLTMWLSSHPAPSAQPPAAPRPPF